MVDSNQSLRQASIRTVTGTTLDYNGDWSALFTAAGVSSSKDWNGRLLDWINLKLSAAYTSLPAAMQALAANLGVYNWSSIGTFNASTFQDFTMDFVNNSYSVGGTSYTLAQTITQTALRTGSGLVIPDTATSPGIQEILGPFLARLIQGQWTIVFNVTGFSTTSNGNSVFFNVQNADLSAAAQLFSANAAGAYNIKFDDYDAGTDNLVASFGAHYDVGSHKIGITRGSFAEPVALAIDGSLIDWFTDSTVPSTAWTKACFGGDYTNGVSSCRNGLTIQSVALTTAVAHTALAALTA